MIVFPVILIITGLLLLYFHKKIKDNIEWMDDNYTGDLTRNKEMEASHNYEKRIKKKFQSGNYYFGLLLLFWGIVFLIILLLF